MKKAALILSPQLTRSGKRHPYLFVARLEGASETICVSEEPLLEAARRLMAMGYDGELTLAARHQGSDHDALSAKLSIAASLTVREIKRGDIPPVFARYEAFPRSRGRARTRPIAKETSLVPGGTEHLPASKREIA